MPTGQPFTALCRLLNRPPAAGRADLHVHSTCSDGTYTPAQVVDLAKRSGLVALALTDHDTLDGVLPAQAAAAGTGVEIIPAVEISTEHAGSEVHLLGYFVRLENAPLRDALDRLRRHRVGRFHAMVERLEECGVSFSVEEVQAHSATGSLGRRHLAALLVKTQRVGTIREAFARYLNDRSRVVVPKLRLPVAEAIALVRGAGGVAAWAHPAYDGTRERLGELYALGLQALEVEYPGHRASLTRELRRLAAELGLAVTGGSDCHGPGPLRRAIGACGVSLSELEALRTKANVVG